MSKSVSLAAAASLAIAALAGPVSAATFTPNSPTGTTPVAFGGTLTIGPPSISCSVSLTGVVNPGGSSITITGGSFTPGSWLCGVGAYPAGFPWTLTPTTTTAVTFTPISVAGAINCSGATTVQWVNPGTIVFSAVVVPGSPNPCQISGTLNTAPSLSIY